MNDELDRILIAALLPKKVGPGVIASIIQWNFIRNGFVFDPERESKMIAEEMMEFYSAPDIISQLREFADMTFVAIGTLAKYYSMPHVSFTSLLHGHESFRKYHRWVQDCYDFAKRVLLDTLYQLLPNTADIEDEIEFEAKIEDILDAALQIVTRHNEKKGRKLDANGKVIKGQTSGSPENDIELAFIDIFGCEPERATPELREIVDNYVRQQKSQLK